MSHAAVRSRLLIAVASIAVLAAGGGLTPAAAADGDASVTVTVTVTGGGIPLHDAYVSVYRDDGGPYATPVGSEATDEQGRVSVTGLPPGEYSYSASANDAGYPERVRGGSPHVEEAEYVTLASGILDETLDLQLGGYIEGSAFSGGVPSSSHVWVWERHPNGGLGRAVGLKFIDDDGHYRIGPLPAGGYVAMLYGGAHNHWWPGNVSPDRAGTIQVRAGMTAGPVDFPLREEGVSLRGVVRGIDGMPHTGGVTIEMYTRGGVQTGWQHAWPDGTFEFWNLPRGTYTLRFVPHDSTDGDAVYLGGAQTFAQARTFVVTGRSIIQVDERLADLPDIAWSGAETATGPGEVVSAVTTVTTPGVRLSYRWLVSDQPIPGATGRTFRPNALYQRQDVSVEITATAPGHATATDVSDPVRVPRTG